MHYVTEILWPLSEWHASDARERDRRLIVYADNTRRHTVRLSVEFFKDNRMKMAPHSRYSPDLAPSDFYLFGYVKECLARRSFVDAEELCEAGRGVLDSIEKSDFASSGSQLDELAEKMHLDQW
jgi:hypothetical protein